MLLFSTGPLCLAFGSRLHNSKWGNYLALIAESFDYFRSDVTVWLNYLIYLVWHIGVIRSSWTDIKYLLYIGLYGWFHGPSEHPTHTSSFFDIVMVYYKILQIDLNIWGDLGQAVFYQSEITARLSDKICPFLANTMCRQEILHAQPWPQRVNKLHFTLAFPPTFKSVILIILSSFPLFLLFRRNNLKMKRDYFCDLENISYHVVWAAVKVAPMFKWIRFLFSLITQVTQNLVWLCCSPRMTLIWPGINI